MLNGKLHDKNRNSLVCVYHSVFVSNGLIASDTIIIPFPKAGWFLLFSNTWSNDGWTHNSSLMIYEIYKT